MSAIAIRGKQPLEGELRVQGSKNAVLPMMAASILNKGTTVIENVPRIQDVFCMMGILTSLGCVCRLTGHRLEICAKTLIGCSVPQKEMEQMRSSIMLLGPLLGRCREAAVYDPGGCRIGRRPIDLHLMALKALGAEILRKEAPLRLRCDRLCGTEILFPYPSVGATENAILAASAAEGITILNGCAREPEIVSLCHFLNGMGACIHGMGSARLVIAGGRPLHDSVYRVSGDRIAAGTYLLTAAACRGELTLTGVDPEELGEVRRLLCRMGVVVSAEKQLLRLKKTKKKQLSGISVVTRPYPGFPTDLQSAMLALMCTVQGESRIEETIFENRFQTAKELRRMGAEIEVSGSHAVIFGGQPLYGTVVKAQDLRGGAALVSAGLCAEGTTVIEYGEHILRGYEDIVRDFRLLGAELCYLDTKE